MLLPGNPLSHLPQSFKREQGRFHGIGTDEGCACIIRPACSDGPMVAIGQADDEIRVSPTTDANDLDALPSEWMMRVRYRDVFRSMAVEGGNVL